IQDNKVPLSTQFFPQIISNVFIYVILTESFFKTYNLIENFLQQLFLITFLVDCAPSTNIEMINNGLMIIHSVSQSSFSKPWHADYGNDIYLSWSAGERPNHPLCLLLKTYNYFTNCTR
ncbi:hypothetical protein MTR67_024925, partial [Solanum verrucosum]